MNNISMEEIINRIKERRFELGYTFQDLADLTHMSKSTLQRYESGAIKNIPLDRLEILASALQVDPEWIMGWENDTNPSSSSGSITANIATLLQDKSEDIQQEALSLLKNFLDCDTRNRGKISSYALGVAGDYQTPEEIEIQLDRLRKECIAAREKEEKENCAPTEKNSLKMVMKL
ncbi:helix-turn-helix domain-containing protein [Senimuribacter intestinalis]|uniref:helix-turn-helix domain-containing protein n=1 Tax=Senimuribacter intestinalis TaxID=2941507 RepID=UPI00203D0B99|nr:helix-turn-helix transcriptional regulator [Senimuribacter intestinalis]